MIDVTCNVKDISNPSMYKTSLSTGYSDQDVIRMNEYGEMETAAQEADERGYE